MTFKDFLYLINKYKESLVETGKALSVAKSSYIEMVGEGINTWASFLEQPEVGMTVREANSLIDLAEWQDSINIPIEELNLATARFGASRGIVDKDLLEDMKVLSLKDFKERHYDVKVNQDNAPRTYSYMVMKRCNETGTLSKVYGDGIEELEESLKVKYDE